ncbi:MAG: S9 family peptidase [Myxococcota bacterium]
MRRLIPNRLGPLYLVMTVLGCAAGQPPSETLHSKKTENAEVPAVAFFNSGMPYALTLSPDGRFVAGILTRGSEDSVVVVDTRHTGEGKRVRALTSIDRERKKGRSIDWVAWANDDTLVVGASSPEVGARIPSREGRLIVVDVETGKADYLTKDWPDTWKRGFWVSVIDELPSDPDHVMLKVYLPTERYPSVRRLNVRNGDLELVQRPIWGVRSWWVDHRGEVRAGGGVSYPEQGNRSARLVGTLVARTSPEEKFKRLRQWTLYEEPDLYFAGFTEDPNTIYVATDEGPDRLGTLYEYDVEERARGRKVFGVAGYDVGTIVTSTIDGRPLYVPYETDKPQLKSIDAGWARIQGLVDRELPNRINRVTSADASETRFVFVSYSDIVPPEFYVIDWKEKTMDPLFVSYPELPRDVLTPMIPVHYTARDGLELHGYLTRPKSDANAPGPVIVLPHGGPWARDTWGWDPWVQFLASRGFTVFQVNFRGSLGYGGAFEGRGYGEWGLAMQDDITDGVRWLIANGIADPDRVGIFGASYGGYAALQGLASTPDLYAAGASWAGVTDLPFLLLRDRARFGRSWIEETERLIGDRKDDRAKLADTSPALQAARIKVPVLVGHGRGDPRVDVKHATRMAKALKAEGVPVELILVDDETHGFMDPTREAEFIERVAAFFEAHLGAGLSNSSAQAGASVDPRTPTANASPAPPTEDERR